MSEKEVPLDVREFNWLQRYIYFYESRGMTMREDGVMIYFMTRLPVGPGDTEHWKRVIDKLRACATRTS